MRIAAEDLEIGEWVRLARNKFQVGKLSTVMTDSGVRVRITGRGPGACCYLVPLGYRVRCEEGCIKERGAMAYDYARSGE